jgi:uncharacterized membrane protein YqjE
MERSLSSVLQDVVRNVQEIVRSEVRLAKVEIKEEAIKAKSSGAMLGAGAITAIFAALFLLLTIVFALSLVIPIWAAALAVGVVLSIAAGVMFTSGMKLFKRIHPTPQRTVETIKENVEWAKQQTR